MKPCTSCTGRSTCAEICDRVQRWADRDYRSIREFTGLDLDAIDVAGRWEVCQAKAFSQFPEFPFLSHKANKVLSSYCSDGMSYLEISKAYKISLSDVESTLKRARAKIALHSSVINRGGPDDE